MCANGASESLCGRKTHEMEITEIRLAGTRSGNSYQSVLPNRIAAMASYTN